MAVARARRGLTLASVAGVVALATASLAACGGRTPLLLGGGASVDAGDAEIDTGSWFPDSAVPVDATVDTWAPPVPDGACPSAASYFAGGCGDPLTDPQNCGGCGHDCAGGACSNGTCVAMPAATLATGQLAPFAIATDGVDMYWMTFGITADVPDGEGGVTQTAGVGAQLLKCAVSGCDNRPTVLATYPPPGWEIAAAGAEGIALGDKNVYWLTRQPPSADPTAQAQYSVSSCAKTGCACAPTALVPNLYDPSTVRVAAGRVFWTQTSNGTAFNFTGSLWSCPAASCPQGAMAIVGTRDGLDSVTADDASVYFSDTETLAGAGLFSCPVGGCSGAPTLLWGHSGVQFNGLPVQVIGDAANLYWTVSFQDPNGDRSQTGTVLQCAKADCAGTTVTLASGRAFPTELAVDGSNLYWLENGAIARCAIGGCAGAPTMVAPVTPTNPYSIGGLALDTTRVYWTDLGPTLDDGRIRWAAK